MSKTKLIKLLLLFSIVYEDLKKISTDLLRGKPERDGAFLLGSNIDIKPKLVEQLNLVVQYSRQQVIFDIFGDGKKLTPCKHLNISSNNIYIYSSYNNNDKTIKVCTGEKDSNFIHTIANHITIPFYIKWLGYSSLNIELFGNYNNVVQQDLESYLKPLPIWSTLIITAPIDHVSLRSLNDEILLKSFTYYTTNPYIRYINYLLINPDKNVFFLNTNFKVSIFVSGINKLTQFDNNFVKNWQEEQITAFINFVSNETHNHQGKNEIEFRDFINQHLNSNSLHNIPEWFLTLQDSHITRYKELLVFNNIASNKIENVQDLLGNGVNIESKLLNGATLLYASAYLGRTEVAKLLISLGADKESTNNEKLTPLMAASLNNHSEIVELLLNLKTKPNTCDLNGNTPLIMSASKGYIKVVELLIKFHADVNAQNKLGDTSLHMASFLGNMDLVKQLLQANANINLKGHSGIPLEIAVIQGHFEMVKLYLSYGPNLAEMNSIVYEYAYEMVNEITTYEMDSIKYILKNNHDAAIAIRALTNIASYNQSEHYVERIEQIKTCLGELESNKSYANLVELCGNIYAFPSFIENYC